MGTQLDFLSYLGYDMSMKIFTSLDDPSDIARVSCVSRSWRDFVIANSLAKHLCLRMFPQLSRVGHVDEVFFTAKSPVAFGSNMEWETLKKEHRAYAFLARGFMSFPEKSIDMVRCGAPESNPVFPVTLRYKLAADFCVVTEIRIKTFKGPSDLPRQWGFPKSVQFCMGGLSCWRRSVQFCMGGLSFWRRLSYTKILMDVSRQDSLDDEFVWTYTSQEFPMVQEDLLQSFKLPEPVLCIGGILQIELRGDGLFNFNGWVPQFEVVGRSLSPAFGVEIWGPSGNFVLKVLSYTQWRTVPQETWRAAKRLRR